MTVHERRVREFQRREADILAAAIRMFDCDAWQQVTIDEIASAVQIGKGTIYKHFASKDELYARLALDFHGASLASLRQREAGLPVLVQLRTLLREYWRLHAEPQAVQRVVRHCETADFRQSLSAPMRARFEAVDAAFGELLLQVLQEGVSQGVLPNRPLRALVFGAQAALFGAIRHAHRCSMHAADEGDSAALDSEALCDDTIDFILAGLTCSAGVAV